MIETNPYFENLKPAGLFYSDVMQASKFTVHIIWRTDHGQFLNDSYMTHWVWKDEGRYNREVQGQRHKKQVYQNCFTQGGFKDQTTEFINGHRYDII